MLFLECPQHHPSPHGLSDRTTARLGQMVLCARLTWRAAIAVAATATGIAARDGGRPGALVLITTALCRTAHVCATLAAY
jgi:hypothetical protein